MSKQSKQPDFSAIYAQVLSLCPPYQQHGPWQAIPVPAGIRQRPEDPEAVVADLRVQHPDAKLLESGVVTTGTEGNLELAPALCDTSTAIIPLRTNSKQDPFDLVTNRGCIATGALPLCACLKDSGIKELSSDENVLCAACSSSDAVALLSLGLPTTLAAGLAKLRGDYLEQVCRCYKLGKYATRWRGGTYLDTESIPQVMVVGWSPATLTLDEPEGVSDIVSHLIGIERYLEICLEGFSLWQLKPAELDEILFRREHFGLSSVGAALWKSLRLCQRTLVPPWTQEDLPKDLGTAIQQLHRSLSTPDHAGEDEKRSWKTAIQMVQSQTTAPWLEQFGGVEDAAERSLMVMGAMSSEIAEIQALQTIMKMTCIGGQKGSTRPGVPGDEQFQQYTKSVDWAIKAIKALSQYRKDSV